MFEILENQSVINISGSDAQKFLQSLLTNDIVNNPYSYNYFLNNKGQYLFDFFVHNNGDNTFFLEINNTKTANLIKCFSLYKLRSDVNIVDVSQTYKVIYSKEELKHSLIKSNKDPRYKKLGIRSIIKQENIRYLSHKTTELYINDKYKYTIPDGSTDLIFEKSIPVEYGAEELNAINYNKGCYIGQEVISRVKYQGVIRKKIYHINSNSGNINSEAGAHILNFKGDKIGILCSAHKNCGIALLREELFLSLSEKIATIGDIAININIPTWNK
jgi:hypothetical protein